jgi:hypothetical protein
MTREALLELAEDIIDSNDTPDAEVNLIDMFASVYEDITAEGKCLVVYRNNLSGDVEDAQIFKDIEEAEEHLNELQAILAEGEADAL